VENGPEMHVVRLTSVMVPASVMLWMWKLHHWLHKSPRSNALRYSVGDVALSKWTIASFPQDAAFCSVIPLAEEVLRFGTLPVACFILVGFESLSAFTVKSTVLPGRTTSLLTDIRTWGPFKDSVFPNNIWKPSLYLTGNTLRVRYRDQPVNVVWELNFIKISPFGEFNFTAFPKDPAADRTSSNSRAISWRMTRWIRHNGSGQGLCAVRKCRHRLHPQDVARIVNIIIVAGGKRWLSYVTVHERVSNGVCKLLRAICNSDVCTRTLLV
jgi:hypothetical protein